MTKIPVSISQLAKYGLDYVSLISSSRSRSRPVKTDLITNEKLSIKEIVFGSEIDSISLSLTTALDGLYDPATPEEEKSDEQKKAEQKVYYDRELLNKLQEIDTKIKTDEYTKRMVLQTGFISFEAKRYLESEYSDDYEKYEAPLLQIPITAIHFRFTADGASVTIDIGDNYIEVLSGVLKNYLPQQYYDAIFKFIADSEAEYKTTLPVASEFIDELWATIRVQLERVDARNISELPNCEGSIVALASKTNHFLAEDLKEIAAFEDEELLETSLGGWVSDEDMAIEQAVSDDGSTEIFFPFDYDKYQLKVLGITGNKAVIVEGPPGTGKSQTISNLLIHLAATGKRVLFASQKDQAIRGVKDKLKTLDIPFLYGYIPDKTSKLYTEKDEKDSAANTLLALNREFQKGKVGDLKQPLALLSESVDTFVESLNNERSVYKLYEERRSLGYLDAIYPYEIDSEWYSKAFALEETIDSLQTSVTDYEATHEKFIKAANKKFENLEIDYQSTIDAIVNIQDYFKANMPERSGLIGGKVNDIKLRTALKKYGQDLLQEIYIEVEKVLLSDNTKSTRLQLLDSLSDYFVYDSEKQAVTEKQLALSGLLKDVGMPADTYGLLKNIIASTGKEKVFQDLSRYDEISEQIEDMSLYSANELNGEIKDIRKFYRTNVTNYVRNRILTRVAEANNSKSIKATLAQVARSLTKSKKANKTFDRLKHNDENFSAMSKVIPIWMMSLDDVSRIVPLEMNAFDYVIIDEASQCNFAYAFPAMFRAQHTIFFGDTLQMRDDNIMFKSNDQLSAIAKKHKIPDVYQIKAEEDTVKSVMDIAHLSGFKTATLKYHYRSPKELIGFSNESFYEPIGRKLEAVNDNIVPYKDTGRILLNHIVKPDDSEEISDKTNFAEIRKIQELVDEIRNDPILKDKSIAILAFFDEQAELIRNTIKDEDVKVSIIDGIQGDERDIVIYSLVIKDPVVGKRMYVPMTSESGEIKKDITAGRVNVAFSRARLQVHTVTSLAPELWPEGIWIKRYLEYVEKYGVVNRRHNKGDQQFDSNFEENVFTYLSQTLDASEYTLDTQVESLGFKIDLVVYRNGKRLALEMDGPSHFEGGDGQVYVKDDWDRQCALETAGWNFYRISYFDWVNDREAEKAAVSAFIDQYFSGAGLGGKTDVLRELEQEMVTPEEASKEMYVTDFSGENVDNVTTVRATSSKSAIKTTASAKKEFSVGDREVNQADFESYLAARVGSVITIKYQTPRAKSANYWRLINLVDYDDTYLHTDAPDGRDYLIKYRRDRVVDFQ